MSRRRKYASRRATQEFFGGNPAYKVDVVEEIDFLDETGFLHAKKLAGREVLAMEYKFTSVPGGTLYENALIAGGDGTTLFGKLVNVVMARLLSDAMGHAWIKHNIEEVGNLSFFLPSLKLAAYDNALAGGSAEDAHPS